MFICRVNHNQVPLVRCLLRPFEILTNFSKLCSLFTPKKYFIILDFIKTLFQSLKVLVMDVMVAEDHSTNLCMRLDSFMSINVLIEITLLMFTGKISKILNFHNSQNWNFKFQIIKDTIHTLSCITVLTHFLKMDRKQ